MNELCNKQWPTSVMKKVRRRSRCWRPLLSPAFLVAVLPRQAFLGEGTSGRATLQRPANADGGRLRALLGHLSSLGSCEIHHPSKGDRTLHPQDVLPSKLASHGDLALSAPQRPILQSSVC